MSVEEMQNTTTPEPTAAPTDAHAAAPADGHDSGAATDPNMDMGGGSANWLVVDGFVALFAGATLARRRPSVTYAAACRPVSLSAPESRMFERSAGLAVFTVVMLATLFGPTMVEENVGSTIVWILWWPLLPLSYFVFSRFWCTVCPYPVVGEWFRRLAGSELEGAALCAVLRHLDHRPHVSVHHMGRPCVRHRRVAARHRATCYRRCSAARSSSASSSSAAPSAAISASSAGCRATTR